MPARAKRVPAIAAKRMLPWSAASAPATAFLAAATPSYRRQCTAWVVSAKQEATRRKRLAQLIDDSAHGRLVAPQRYGDAPGWLVRAAAAASEAAS